MDAVVRCIGALSLALVSFWSVASSASAFAGDWQLVSYASDRGVHRASSGFDTGVAQPRRLELAVRVKPDKQIRLKYQVGCRGGGEAAVNGNTLKTRSARIPLTLGVGRARSCTVYAFAEYRNGKFDGPVSFRVELRAQLRT